MEVVAITPLMLVVIIPDEAETEFVFTRLNEVVATAPFVVLVSSIEFVEEAFESVFVVFEASKSDAVI